MKRIYLLVIFLITFSGNAFCQKAAKENFLTIAKSYLEFTEKLYRLDSNTTVFRISAGSYKQDSVFFDITFKDVNFMIDEKYTDVYTLNNYKLIFYGPSDKNTNILKKTFKKTKYENLNQSKSPDLKTEDFHWWRVNLNNEYKITSIEAGNLVEATKVLKKNKACFSDKFSW